MNAMRLLLRLSPSREAVNFDHSPVLTGALHKWLGPNNDIHDGISLYSFSWLTGGITRHNALHFPRGAGWFISALDGDFLTRSVQGILRAPEVRWGMRVEEVKISAPPDFSDYGEVRFLCGSPIFIKREIPNPDKPNGKEEKHFTFKDPESDLLLTETLRTKLRAAGLTDAGVSVRFDRDYPKARTQKVGYGRIYNMCSYCPVWVRGTREQLEFVWTVGLGSSSGIGLGSLWVPEKAI